MLTIAEMLKVVEKPLRMVLPGPVRRWGGKHCRNLLFHAAMREFQNDPNGAIANKKWVISSLIYGWGNESWSALDEYVVACLALALKSEGPILECGSGLTTLLLGAVAQRTGRTVWSLEHNDVWGSRVNRCLAKFQISSVRLNIHPMKDYGEYSWYDPPLDAMPERFSLIVCDGPPADTKGGRYGFLPVMAERLNPNCIILLDDAERQHEQNIAARWAEELNAKCEFLGVRKPYIKINVGNRND